MAIPGFDGTGIYTRHYSWRADETNSIGIVSDRHDAEDDEFAKGLNLAFCRDGQATATGNFKMGNYKITGLGAATADNDAVPLSQLTGSSPSGIPDIQKALNLTGIDAAGRLNFMGLTGVEGIGWAGADLSWVAKIKVASQYTNRLALNNAFDATGTDVAWFEDNGNLRVPSLIQNLAIDPAGQLRVISAGYGAQLRMDSTGVAIAGIDTPTSGGSYLLPATGLQDRIILNSYAGSATVDLHKKDATTGLNAIRGYTGTASLRWVMQLGTSTAEGSGDTGTNFQLSAYSNAGASKYTVMTAGRNDGKVNFPQGHGGILKVDDSINNPVANLVLGGSGMIVLRPNGEASATGQATIGTTGDLTLSRYLLADGIAERNGVSGSNGSSHYNFNYVPGLQAWIDDTNLGTISFTCDYRVKKDIKPLASTWDKVKALRPVSYTPREFREGETMLSLDSDEERWGFLAHELQESLLPSAAEGTKDEEHRLQNVNLLAVVAGLTVALQEAQLRIEALESKLA